MQRFYKSDFYKKPIEVDDIEGEKLVIITDNNNKETIYSWYDTEEKNTECFYINKCLLGGFIKKIPQNVLIIGFGGGSFAKYLEDHIENIYITGIEIDKTMIEISKKEMLVKTNDIYLSETDITLEDIIAKNLKYDLVLIDVYGSDGEIPDYFSSNIFFEKLKQVLDKNGTISINYSNYLINEKNRLKTYKKIHENFLKYFSKYFSFIIEGEEDNGNKVGIYNLDKKYTKSDFELNYLKNVELNNIGYDEKIFLNFKVLTD